MQRFLYVRRGGAQLFSWLTSCVFVGQAWAPWFLCKRKRANSEQIILVFTISVDIEYPIVCIANHVLWSLCGRVDEFRDGAPVIRQSDCNTGLSDSG